MKRNLLFIIALFVCALSFGQGEIDAYRYSSYDLSGTARGQAMGGAFGALGGDVTGVAINPAGIGVYRSSEILANMSLTSPSLGGATNLESNTKVAFDNLSYVSYYPLVKGGMLSLNFGFNYNRIKSFDQRYSASTKEMNSSLTDYMVHLTNGIRHSTWTNNDLYYYSDVPWLSILAYDGYLINGKYGTNDQYESILNENEHVSPSLKVSERGRIESYDFTIGSNILNKFYWGATVSITDISYVMNASYDENFLGVEGSGFSLNNYLETKGSGFQLKTGVIFKPTDALRLGLSYHSPVWYTMTDYFHAGLTPRGIDAYDDNGNYIGSADYTETPNDAYVNYRFRTPGSWTFSVAAVLGTQAILSLDYENKNYAAMNLKDKDGYDWKDVNDIMSKSYKNTSTVRAGFEYRFSSRFSGRLGYAWVQNPFRSDIESTGEVVVTAGTIPHYTLTGDVNYLTTGIGFKFTPQFYGDFALVHRTQKDDLYYFTPVESVGINPDSFAGTFTNKTLRALVTLGYKF